MWCTWRRHRWLCLNSFFWGCLLFLISFLRSSWWLWIPGTTTSSTSVSWFVSTVLSAAEVCFGCCLEWSCYKVYLSTSIPQLVQLGQSQLHLLLSSQQIYYLDVSLRHLLGQPDVPTPDFSQPPRIVVHHAIQTLYRPQDRENLIEATGYLVEETHFDLIQMLLHDWGGLGYFWATAGEEGRVSSVLVVEEVFGYVFVALGDELRSEGGYLSGFRFFWFN